jgi:cell division protein ZapA
MTDAAVELRVAGQIYRVVTSASKEELTRLGAVVERALYEVTPPGRQPAPNALVLAAMTLAHELEEERAKRIALEARHREILGRVLTTIDEVLGEEPDDHANSPFEAATQTDEVAALAHRRRGPAALQRID